MAIPGAVVVIIVVAAIAACAVGWAFFVRRGD